VNRRRPPIPRLMLVTDRTRAGTSLPALLAAAVAGGCDAIQVRDKDAAEDERRLLLAQAIAAAGPSATVLVNGDIDLAALYGVGLHLPEDGLRSSAAREKLGPDVLIGRSVHSPEAARECEGANYLLAGNVLPTESHPGRPPLGPAGLAAIVAATDLPVLAIGGIEPENVAVAIEAGAAGVAVIGAILSAADPAGAHERANRLRRRLDQALGGQRTDGRMSRG
jgi:thiamine-phosphate pyrophosphorylase